MRFSSIVVVLLKLFALYWFVAFAIGILGALGTAGTIFGAGMSGAQLLPAIFLFLPAVAYLLLAIPAWIFAPKIARVVTGEHDFSFGKTAIEPKDLYTLGLLVVGAYLFLSHLGGSVSWLYYLAVNQAGDDLLNEREGLSLYDVAQQFVPCLGGLYLACLSQKFGRRLAAKESVTEN